MPIAADSFQKHVACDKPRKVGNVYFFVFNGGVTIAIFVGVMVLLARCFSKGFSLRCGASHRVRVMCGMLIAIGGTVGVFSSLPERVPVFIQPLLGVTGLPLTVLFRYLILKKKVSVPRLICIFASLVGIVIATEPVIFKMNADSSVHNSPSHARPVNQVLWILVSFLSGIPYAIMVVLLEGTLQSQKSTKESTAKEDVDSLLFNFWVNVWAAVGIGMLFWMDFIPWFGQSKNFSEFASSMKAGYGCLFGAPPSPYSYPDCTLAYLNSTAKPADMFNPDPHCTVPTVKFYFQIFCTAVASPLSFLVVKYTDGAIFFVLVQTLCTPLSTVFWFLVHLNSSSHLYWEPAFNEGSAYVLAGLAVLFPAVAIYNYLGYTAERRFPDQREERDINSGEILELENSRSFR